MPGWLRGVVKSAWFWAVLWTLLVLGVVSWVLIERWAWFSDGEPVSSVIRNLVLAVAAVIALPLAIWRSIVAERQADTAQQALLNDRYQKGAEMLGDGVLSVRLGGIYALLHLAENYPKQYHIQVIKLLCAFVRNPPKEELPLTASSLREDVQAVMTAIGGRREAELGYEKTAGDFQLDLRGADLRGANLRGANLYRTMLANANLSGENTNLFGAILVNANLFGANLSSAGLVSARLMSAILVNAKLPGAKLMGANLSVALLTGADLSGADLVGACLKGADLSGAKIGATRTSSGEVVFSRLTQAQLDKARADPENPPKIDDGTIDFVTDKQLVWCGKSSLQGGS